MFRFQIWLIGLTGIDLTTFSKAGLSAISFLFDIIFPFLVLFIVSLFTKSNSERVLQEFYARVHTPAMANQELDAIEVQKRIDDPALVEQDKMFPGTNWEFWKLTKKDMVGFGLCWLGVGAIVLLYIVLMNIRIMMYPDRALSTFTFHFPLFHYPLLMQSLHPDFETTLPDTDYFVLGSGSIQAAIQWSRHPGATPLGLVLSDPAHVLHENGASHCFIPNMASEKQCSRSSSMASVTSRMNRRR